MIAYFGDESFQTINCTGTDNQKQSNTTLHTPETQKRNRKKTALTNKTIFNLDLVRLLRPPVRKRSGPYSYSPGAHTGQLQGKQTVKDQIFFKVVSAHVYKRYYFESRMYSIH